MIEVLCPLTPLQPSYTLRQQGLQARFVQKDLASLLHLGARTHSFESRSPVLGKVVDGWEDGAARGGRVVGGSGKVFGVAVLGTTPSPKL